MKAAKKTYQLIERLERRGINASFDQANTLRRAELTLHGWAEKECGFDGYNTSYVYERDEETGKTYLGIYPYTGKSRRQPIPDRETGALKRVQKVCKELGIFYYHQTDPRGCALYVDKEPLPANDYTKGIAIH